jgi:hypothetical protein
MYFQFPKVEECDFDRQFLFDEYVAISHRYGLRLLHTMNVRFSLLDIAQRILGVTLPNFQ